MLERTVNNFIQKHGGPDAVIRFLRHLNNGKPLAEIAVVFGVSVGRISILKNRMFAERYILRPATEKALDQHIRIRQSQANEDAESIEKANREKTEINRRLDEWIKRSLN